MQTIFPQKNEIFLIVGAHSFTNYMALTFKHPDGNLKKRDKSARYTSRHGQASKNFVR